MDTVVIILLLVLSTLLLAMSGFLLWDRLHRERKLKDQGEDLAKVVEEKIDGKLSLFVEIGNRLGELNQRTKDIEEVGKNISSLQEALRAPKFRGQFGEVGLEALLTNILPAGSYSLQRKFRNGEVIVDAVVQIGKNFVPIDSKFPFLEDFERMVKAESGEEQAKLKRQFTRSVKKHIDDVAKYILPDENTFDFALMYIPAENIYYEMIIGDTSATEENSLYSYCCDKRVFPISPNTFYAYLKAILLGLEGLRIESTAREIQGHLRRLRGDLSDFQKDYTTLGVHISHASQKHDEAGRKLTRLGDKLQLAGETPMEKLPEGTVETDHEDEA